MNIDKSPRVNFCWECWKKTVWEYDDSKNHDPNYVFDAIFNCFARSFSSATFALFIGLIIWWIKGNASLFLLYIPVSIFLTMLIGSFCFLKDGIKACELESFCCTACKEHKEAYLAKCREDKEAYLARTMPCPQCESAGSVVVREYSFFTDYGYEQPEIFKEYGTCPVCKGKKRIPRPDLVAA